MPRLLISACLPAVAVLMVSCGRPAPVPPPPVRTAIPVQVGPAGMLRGGQPYFVKGAGGGGSMEELAARGANSIRTWDTQGLAQTLDKAERLGLTVSAGLWLESECGWFSYANPAHCDKQAERVRKQVVEHRNHPALLAWGIGNEAEGDGSNSAFWRQLDRLARMVKDLDPAHPAFTAVAGASKAKVEGLLRDVPHLDYLGINTYQGVFTLRRHLKEVGWNRPWMLTEWGPRGFWEAPRSASDAPVEQTSSEKAEMIRRAYGETIFPGDGCLGSYVFVWGWKFEATATWFGVFTHEGETTATADVLQEMWGKGKPVNQAPSIDKLRDVPASPVAAGAAFSAQTEARDPDGDPLVCRWAVLPQRRKSEVGKGQVMPKVVPDTVITDGGPRVDVKAPAVPGIYRLHVWVKDGKGHAATANRPFEVR